MSACFIVWDLRLLREREREREREGEREREPLQNSCVLCKHALKVDNTSLYKFIITKWKTCTCARPTATRDPPILDEHITVVCGASPPSSILLPT